MRFNTFDQVAAAYNNIKPIKSKYHTGEHDVRPIGQRRRKWERIKKIDDNTYALCDGSYGNHMYGNVSPEQHEYENAMAPILWMRREDGDFIRIRNHLRGACSYSRYNFLRWQLPKQMWFGYNQQGQHWIEYAGTQYHLPKSKGAWNNQSQTFTDDNMFLLFRANEDGTFTRAGNKMRYTSTHVDKALKDAWRARIESFYTYCGALAPIIKTDWEARHEYTNMIRGYTLDWGTRQGMGNLVGAYMRPATTGIPSDLVREIVTEEDHPMRVAFAALVVYEIDAKRVIESKAQLQSIRSAFNRLMNKTLNLYKVEEV
jgi:hypothetical protein